MPKAFEIVTLDSSSSLSLCSIPKWPSTAIRFPNWARGEINCKIAYYTETANSKLFMYMLMVPDKVGQTIVGNRIEIGQRLNVCKQIVIRHELTFVTKVPWGKENFFLNKVHTPYVTQVELRKC